MEVVHQGTSQTEKLDKPTPLSPVPAWLDWRTREGPDPKTAVLPVLTAVRRGLAWVGVALR